MAIDDRGQDWASGKSTRLRQFAARESLSREACHALDTLGDFHPMGVKGLVSITLAVAGREGFDADTIMDAIPPLIAAGYIERTTQKTLQRIRAFLACDPALGPVFELPSEGKLDLTFKGAEFYWRLSREVYGVTPENRSQVSLRQVRSGRLQVFGTERASVAEFFFDEIYRAYDHVVAGPLREIGPWRARWWELIPHGWRICAQVKGRNPRPAGDPAY